LAVQFGVLGPWEVDDRGTGAVPVPPGQLRTLLMALILTPGQPVSAEALGERLWPRHGSVQVDQSARPLVVIFNDGR
jgi:DNA-binding SARP family transcriptional activator